MSAIFTFKPGVEGNLTRFRNSPDEGDPECKCSWCGKVIPEGESALRMWPENALWEIRLHVDCAKDVIDFPRLLE